MKNKNNHDDCMIFFFWNPHKYETEIKKNPLQRHTARKNLTKICKYQICMLVNKQKKKN